MQNASSGAEKRRVEILDVDMPGAKRSMKAQAPYQQEEPRVPWNARGGWAIAHDNRVRWPLGLPITVTGCECNARVWNLHALPHVLKMAKHNRKYTVSPDAKHIVFIMAVRASLIENPRLVDEFKKLHELQLDLYSYEQTLPVYNMYSHKNRKTKTVYSWIENGACFLFDMCVVLDAIKRDGTFGDITKCREQSLHLQMLEFEKMNALADSSDDAYFKSHSHYLGVPRGGKYVQCIEKSEQRKLLDDQRIAVLKNKVCCQVRDHVWLPMCAALMKYQEEHGIEVTVWK